MEHPESFTDAFVARHCPDERQSTQIGVGQGLKMPVLLTLAFGAGGSQLRAGLQRTVGGRHAGFKLREFCIKN
jgi:hypothetical protein